MSYIKDTNPGFININLKNDDYLMSYTYNKELLSFGDVKFNFSLELVFNPLCIEEFNLPIGFKFNINKKIIFSNNHIYLLDEIGNITSFMEDNGVYISIDYSKIILRRNNNNQYELEYSDGTIEIYNQSGYIISTLDKYNNLCLSFTYAGSILDKITYNDKELVFNYSSNDLESIDFICDNQLINELSFSYLEYKVIINHYNGIRYELSYSNILFNALSFDSNELNNDNFEQKVSLSYSPNIVIEKYIGTKLILKDEYEYLTPYSYEKKDINNIKYRYKHIQGMINACYEVIDDYISLENQSILFNDIDMSGVINFNDGYNFNYNNHTWFINDIVNIGTSKICIYGYLYTEESFLSPTITVYKDSASISSIIYTKQLDMLPTGKKDFFYCIIDGDFTNYNQIIVEFDYVNFITPSNIKLVKESNTVKLNNLILKHKLNNTIIHINDLFDTFEYKLVNSSIWITVEGIVNISDLLKYLINKKKNIHTNEFYYNNFKCIINNVSSIRLLKNNIYYYLDDYYIGTYSTDPELYEIINLYKFDDPLYFLKHETINYIINNPNNITEQNITCYNNNLDLEYSNIDNLISEVTYFNYGLVASNFIKSGNLEINNLNYYNANFTKLIKTVDEEDKETLYELNDLYGNITKVISPDESNVEYITDDSSKYLIQNKFSKNSDVIINGYEYDKDFITKIYNSNLYYEFTYDCDEVSTVFKNNFLVVSYFYNYDTTDNNKLTITKTIPITDNTNYVKNIKYDKYNRLYELSDFNNLGNEVMLCKLHYDLFPTIGDNDEFHFIGFDNSNSLISYIEDYIQNRIIQYGYDEKRNIKCVLNRNTSLSILNKELFTYDYANRLTCDKLILDYSLNTAIEYNYSYKTNELSINRNELLNSLSFKYQDLNLLNISYLYDTFNRINIKTSNLNNLKYKRCFTYYLSNNKTSSKLTSYQDYYINNDNVDILKNNISLAYDLNNRITSIIDSANNYYNKQYIYDSFGRLIRENNLDLNNTICYEYDILGNIINKSIYLYSLEQELSSPISTYTYSYDLIIKDRLCNFFGSTISYSFSGCPTRYKDKTYTWDKSLIKKVTTGNIRITGLETIEFKYDYLGNKVKKIYSFIPGRQALAEYITNAESNFLYDYSNKLIKQTTFESYNTGVTINYELLFIYDETGICGVKFTYNNQTTIYYYKKNILGDVEEILDINNNLITRYAYDAYGNYIIKYNSGSLISNINPIRYRSYYYDNDLRLYYLYSRYYDPETCRFISPDLIKYLDPTTINGLNLYAYCGNDPINYYDPSGHIATGLILGGTALYYLLAGLVILIVGTGAVIASQTDFQNISFDVPFEWKASWNNLSDNVYNMWSYISNWWNGLFNYTSDLASAETEVNNSYSLIDYYILQSIQDRYARPNQKKQGRELKNKARARFTTKCKFRNGRKPPKHHTPGRGHSKYIWWLLWRILNHEEED